MRDRHEDIQVAGAVCDIVRRQVQCVTPQLRDDIDNYQDEHDVAEREFLDLEKKYKEVKEKYRKLKKSISQE